MGGPGGVLIRGTGLPVGIPVAGDGTLGVLIAGEGIWFDSITGGGGNLGVEAEGEGKEGVPSFVTG